MNIHALVHTRAVQYGRVVMVYARAYVQLGQWHVTAIDG
jgi:hypothetical protein